MNELPWYFFRLKFWISQIPSLVIDKNKVIACLEIMLTGQKVCNFLLLKWFDVVVDIRFLHKPYLQRESYLLHTARERKCVATKGMVM